MGIKCLHVYYFYYKGNKLLEKEEMKQLGMVFGVREKELKNSVSCIGVNIEQKNEMV